MATLPGIFKKYRSSQNKIGFASGKHFKLAVQGSKITHSCQISHSQYCFGMHCRSIANIIMSNSYSNFNEKVSNLLCRSCRKLWEHMISAYIVSSSLNPHLICSVNIYYKHLYSLFNSLCLDMKYDTNITDS